MAMKKGYCTNCNRDDEVRRIFDVNSDARWCYCPHCGKKYKPSVVIENYKKTIDKYNRKAYFYLRHAGEYRLGYDLFAYVLELEPTNRTAKLGRLLSLANLSTTRRNRFTEVRELMDIERPLFHDKTFTREYTAYLISLNSCIDVYCMLLRKNLTIKDYFYDVACIKLYYRHIADAILLKRMIVEECSTIGEEKLSAKVSDSIKDLENTYNKVNFTADGQDHYLANFTKTGDPLITNGRRKIDTKLARYRLSTLDTKDKKLNIISENVFGKVRLRTYHAFKSSLPVSIILFILFVGALITYLCLKNNPNTLPILISAIICGFFSISFIVLRVLCYMVLKRPKF